MLEIRELEVSYGPVEAVRGIDLDVEMGEVVALIGPNGAGKTSTLRAISGLVPHGGTVTFDGVDCRKLNIEGSRASGLIHVPEGRHVFPSLNVHENLQVGATGGRRADRGLLHRRRVRPVPAAAAAAQARRLGAVGRRAADGRDRPRARRQAADAAARRAVTRPVAEVHPGGVRARWRRWPTASRCCSWSRTP